MIIETTLNIQDILLEKITLTAELKGISRTEVIIHLLKMVMKDAPKHVRNGKRIEYQSRHNHGIWRTLHIQIRPNDYECMLDLRKFLKMSVSHILAYAINKYLDRLIKSRITENYHYTNYLLLKDDIEGIPCWKLIWGIPRNLEILFHEY